MTDENQGENENEKERKRWRKTEIRKDKWKIVNKVWKWGQDVNVRKIERKRTEWRKSEENKMQRNDRTKRREKKEKMDKMMVSETAKEIWKKSYYSGEKLCQVDYNITRVCRDGRGKLRLFWVFFMNIQVRRVI